MNKGIFIFLSLVMVTQVAAGLTGFEVWPFSSYDMYAKDRNKFGVFQAAGIDDKGNMHVFLMKSSSKWNDQRFVKLLRSNEEPELKENLIKEELKRSYRQFAKSNPDVTIEKLIVVKRNHQGLSPEGEPMIANRVLFETTL